MHACVALPDKVFRPTTVLHPSHPTPPCSAAHNPTLSSPSTGLLRYDAAVKIQSVGRCARARAVVASVRRSVALVQGCGRIIVAKARVRYLKELAGLKSRRMLRRRVEGRQRFMLACRASFAGAWGGGLSLVPRPSTLPLPSLFPRFPPPAPHTPRPRPPPSPPATSTSATTGPVRSLRPHYPRRRCEHPCAGVHGAG